MVAQTDKLSGAASRLLLSQSRQRVQRLRGAALVTRTSRMVACASQHGPPAVRLDGSRRHTAELSTIERDEEAHS
jgi:hypothetical protein